MDADSGAPLTNATIQIAVMRVSSYDGTSELRRYTYASDEQGEFLLPARKKVVDSVTERMEEVRYFELIVFAKAGYRGMQYRTDAEDGPFSPTATEPKKIVVRLKKLETPSAN